MTMNQSIGLFALVVSLVGTVSVWKRTTFHDSTESVSIRRSSSNEQAARKNRIPNFLLVGAQKGGTTSIVQYVYHHANVCVPTPHPGQHASKEAHVFDETATYALGLEHYQQLFQQCKEARFVMDATPGYLIWPERVYDFYQQQGTADTVKILVSLREPVSREMSWYRHMRRSYHNNETTHYLERIIKVDGTVRSFKEHVEENIVRSFEEPVHNFGLYAHWLERWFRLFPRNNILVVSYDEFKANSTHVLEQLHRFLDIPVKTLEPASHFNSRHVDPGPMPCSVQTELAERYEDSNQQLYKLLEAYPGPPMESRPFSNSIVISQNRKRQGHSISSRFSVHHLPIDAILPWRRFDQLTADGVVRVHRTMYKSTSIAGVDIDLNVEFFSELLFLLAGPSNLSAPPYLRRHHLRSSMTRIEMIPAG